jgi:hypothetical protein
MEKPKQEFIEEASQFNEKINNINAQFFSALDDFKKYYVYYNKNPEVTEFQNYYANSKGQLQSLSKELVTTTNNINKSIESLDTEMSSNAIQLEREKKRNKELTKLVFNLENTQNGSEILIDDTKVNYNIQYYKNWELIAGILVTGIMLGRWFSVKKLNA